MGEEARSSGERTATSSQGLWSSEKKRTSLDKRSRSLERADVLEPKTSKDYPKELTLVQCSSLAEVHGWEARKLRDVGGSWILREDAQEKDLKQESSFDEGRRRDEESGTRVRSSDCKSEAHNEEMQRANELVASLAEQTKKHEAKMASWAKRLIEGETAKSLEVECILNLDADFDRLRAQLKTVEEELETTQNRAKVAELAFWQLKEETTDNLRLQEVMIVRSQSSYELAQAAHTIPRPRNYTPGTEQLVGLSYHHCPQEEDKKDAGYNQVSIREQDKDKTTFITNWGTYAYYKMPFGLCHAPATFQRMMSTIFQDHLRKFLETIIDHFCVFGSHAQHLDNLQQTFKRCMESSYQALEEGRALQMGREQHKGFEALKAQLSFAPVLQSPNWDKPYHVYVDPLAFVIGVVLSQWDKNKKDYPIYFASRQLSATEKNYTTIEREALAMVFSCKKF
ncbi:hypothetical protein AXG93_1614s1000 [Marchantia polymorpha subsp. ruderalis]|uniref:Uncharacterized protein n=1 Tax=Marchantia polymorpha subsp. ruderalis TaxID=1480154 RepID=A0A176W7Z8_MARPO|nr:hypothetical protein AXG93_1614s1000 [Marchantia polymorpha subsp. ruderalis]